MNVSTVTLVGAVVAATASCANLWWQYLDRRGQYVVRWGRLEPTDLPGFQFYVVNVGKSPITLVDYGFVFADGHFASLPQGAHEAWEESGDHDFQLLNELAPHKPQQSGGMIAADIVAAYALSATQSWPRLAFNPRSRLGARMRLRLKILIRGDSARRSVRVG